jgi:hypothetical protein
LIDGRPEQKIMKFDFVAGEDVNQERIFNEIARPIADFCLEGKPGLLSFSNISLGYNGTIFAYGQTGAGKTYTIQGP